VKDRADIPSLQASDQLTGLFRRDRDKINVSARCHVKSQEMGYGSYSGLT
jgi:hypothetical protein